MSIFQVFMATFSAKESAGLLRAAVGDYDGARVVFLPIILSLALCFGAQEPANGWLNVAAADPDVPASTLEMVRIEAAAGLVSLREAFPALPHRPFRIFVHVAAASLPIPLQAGHHAGSPGFALPQQHEIHVLLAELRAAGIGFRPVLVHELTHELLHQHCEPWGERLPRWLHEGLAQVLAGDTYLGASEANIIWRVTADQLLPFSSLGEDFPREPVQLQLAYAQSYSYVAWLQRKLGLQRLLAIAGAVDRETTFQRALVIATRETIAELEEAWRDYLLHSSGARWRAIMDQCFSLSMIFALPLLALAMIRRMRADRLARERLDRAERAGATGADPSQGGSEDA